MPLPKSRKKLLNLFGKIKDDSIRNIISEVIDLENEYRSSMKFPLKRVEDTIDNEANLIELNMTRKGKKK